MDFPLLLQNMAEKNEHDMKSIDAKKGYFQYGIAPHVVFLLCDRLRLPARVKFAAVELFDRFMQKHLEQLHDQVLSSSEPDEEKHSDWLSIQERVQSQLFLRIVSCCQIASKLNSHYKVISVNKARQCLREMGKEYTATSILQSELRVLNTVEFRVTVLSPLDFVEALLQALAFNTAPADLPVSDYLSVCRKLLVLIYLKANSIYPSLLHCPSPSAQSKSKLLSVQTDKLLMSTGVIAASVYICDQEHTDLVIEQLHCITHLTSQDMEEFVCVLLEEINKDGE